MSRIAAFDMGFGGATRTFFSLPLAIHAWHALCELSIVLTTRVVLQERVRVIRGARVEKARAVARASASPKGRQTR